MKVKTDNFREIYPRLYRINFGFVSAYLYKTDETYICFDTGINPGRLGQILKANSIDIQSVKAVFLTHSDRDHTGGLPALPAATVYMSADEEAMINREKARFFGIIYTRHFNRPYTTLADSQKISIDGTTVSAISTPGHTPGSMSFLVNEAILIVGDILNLKNDKAVMDRGIIMMDVPLQRESLQKLSAIRDVKILCSAHSGCTENFEYAMQDWRS